MTDKLLGRWVITHGLRWGLVIEDRPDLGGHIVQFAPKQDAGSMDVGEIDRGPVGFVEIGEVAATFAGYPAAASARYNALRMLRPRNTAEQVRSYLSGLDEGEGK